MNLPTQLEVLERKLIQRDCEHEWKHIGFNFYITGSYVVFYCPRCEKERTEYILID